jgi:hypothetical protein
LSAQDANQLKREISSTKGTAEGRTTRCSDDQRRKKEQRNKLNNNKYKTGRKHKKKNKKNHEKKHNNNKRITVNVPEVNTDENVRR